MNAAPDVLTLDLSALRRRGVDRHEIACELPVPWLREVLSSTDAEVGEEGRVDLALHLQPRGVVVVTGDLHVAFEVPCGRCLTLAPVSEHARVVATYVAHDTKGAAAAVTAARHEDDDDDDDVGLSRDDLDVWSYEGSTLSLVAMTAEHVKLAYPMRVLCFRGDACRGLCSNCGADLNAQDPDGTTCEACGLPVPRTPVADPPSSGGGPAGAGPDPAPDAVKSLQQPLQAALRKLRS